jgi:cytosine/creatinine deaminase
MDLIVRQAQRADRPPGRLIDVGIEGGRLVAFEPTLDTRARPAMPPVGWPLPALSTRTSISTKTRLPGGCPTMPERVIPPVPCGFSFMPEMSAKDVYSLGEETLCACIVRAATRVRAHVEADPTIGMRAFGTVDQLWVVC